MLLKILLATAAVAAVLFAVKDGRMLEEAGLVGSCSSVATPAGQTGFWHACRPGKLEGRPDLALKSCVSEGTSGEVEYWRCPARIDARSG